MIKMCCIAPCSLCMCTCATNLCVGGHNKSRLQQLVDWSGGSDFNGCLVFDECHKAKHFVPDNENRSTKIAQAVITIQRYCQFLWT